MKPRTRTTLFAVLFAGAIGFSGEAAAAEQAQPRKALGIDSPDVTKYAVRVRASGRLFQKAKVAVRDLLGTFSEPASTFYSNFESKPDGFNTILDPGYDIGTAAAGGVRTTPLEMMWSWRDDACAGDDAACLAQDKETSKRFHWLQVRAPEAKCNKDDRVNVPAACTPGGDTAGNGGQTNYGDSVAGGVLCNQRGVPPYWQANQRENGFYVSADGNCFVEQNVCMSNLGMPTRPSGDPGGWCMDDTCTAHQYNELGTLCDMEAQYVEPANEIYMNVGVFIFPNGLVENAGAGAAFATPVPDWGRPVTLNYAAAGDYFGWVPTKRYGTYGGRDAAYHPLRKSAIDGANYWIASGFPPNKASYNEANPYSEYFGSYFRQGDDIAFYADVRQMQIHSIDRDSVSTAAHGALAVAGCGQSWVYTGQIDGDNKPVYFLARVPQCLRPKAYWHGAPNVAVGAKNKWVACNAYDTFLSDGWTLNPNRDDNYVIYPGNDAAKKCGVQVDQWLPVDAAGAGTGWSALRMDAFDLDTANNKVDLKLTGNDWRIELSMFYAFATECIVAVSYTAPVCDSQPGYQQKRKWAQGTMMIKDVVLQGSVKLFSFDEDSCKTAGGDCTDPWGPSNDKMIRPDRLHIDLALPTVALNMYPDPTAGNWGGGWGTQRNAYRAIYGDLGGYGRSCFAIVYDECAFAMARFDNPDVDGTNAAPELILPQIVDALGAEFNNQFRDMLVDTVADLNDGIPALSALLGDPWSFGKSLVDAGIFVTGSAADYTADPTWATRNIWVLPFKAAPAGRDAVIDVNAALGFRPIAFESPIPANRILKIDNPADGIAASSFFASTTKIYPDTAACKLEVKGAGAYSIATATSAINTWTQTGATFTYAPATGWLTGLGVTPSGRNIQRAFFNRTNWKWGLIIDAHKTGAMNPASAYKIDLGRGVSPGDGSFSASAAWGISDGWIQITVPTTGLFTDIRLGDQFYLTAYPNAIYTVIGLNAATRAVRLDVVHATQNRAVPFKIDGTAASAYGIISRNCSRSATLYPALITGDYDYSDFALDRSFTDPKTGLSYSGRDVIQPYYMADASLETAPSWCTLPQRVRQDEDALAARFPMKTWLTFGATDTPPPGFDASASLPSPANYTLGGWDFVSTTYQGATQEQITKSDAAVTADLYSRGNWLVTTTNVSNANKTKALRAGNFTTDMATVKLITQPRTSTTYNVWVAQSRVAIPPAAGQQVSRSDLQLFNSSGSRGTWTRTTTGVSNSNTSSATAGAMRSAGNNDTLTTPFTTNMPAGTVFHVWVAHSRIAVSACTTCPNPILSVRVDGVQVGSTISWTEDNRWQWTRVGTVTLGAAAHTIAFNCTSTAANKVCGVDGALLTTVGTDPRTDGNFNPYTTANWDAAPLTFYDDGTVRPAVNTTLAVSIDGVQVGATITQTADNTWTWVNLGTRALTGGPHTLTFNCTSGNNNRCAVDGIMLSSTATNPGTAVGFTPYTTADWDAAALDFYTAAVGTAGRGIVRAGQNDYSQKEQAATEYDLSLHLHQRTLNQLAMAVVGSGSGCLEFSDTDPETGEASLWADFMNAERFAAFIPEMGTKFRGWKTKLQIAPQRSPRVRTGVGSLSVTPLSAGSAPIVAEPYTIAAAFPDLQINFVVVDPKTQAEITVLRLNWNAVVGLYARAMRQCHTLDPLKNSPECTSLDPLVRTITGYWQVYLDYGNQTLSEQFEPPANSIDAFSAGRFTRGDFVCPECTPSVGLGEAKFEVLLANCGTGCQKLGLANSITLLLDSTLSLFLETRASTTFLSLPLDMDILYVGPDGPNDDNLGTDFAGSRGDYLGLYIRLFGKDLDIMALMDGMTTMLAPPAAFIPQATVPALDSSPYITTNSPTFDVKMLGGDAASYTYRVDRGFWRTPRSNPQIEFSDLTEGSHSLELRSVLRTDQGWVNQLEPTFLQFVVDSLAPNVSIPPASKGVYRSGVPILVEDYQTPDDLLDVAYSLDDGDWETLDDKRVPLRWVSDGRHTLRVKATDLAGNTATAAREIVVKGGGGCGCHSARPDEVVGMSLMLLALLGAHALLRRQRRQ